MAKKVKTKAKTPAKARKPQNKLKEKVPTEYVFWCHDGSVFTDVSELAAGLMNMTDEIFAYHCNPEKQDFSNWIRDVIGDEILADELARAADRLQAADCVSIRLREI
jgi:hypothetical protein